MNLVEWLQRLMTNFGAEWIMWVLIALSVVSVAIMFERAWFYLSLREDLPALENFVLPGGSVGSAQLHVARAVCRRAERLVVALSRTEAVGDQVIVYLNRLSDALFVMARWENRRKGVPDVLWNSRA